jgi:hypothetical protein
MACSIIGYAITLGIGPVPTSRKVLRRLEEVLPKDVAHITELGCGWGTLLRTLVRRYPKGSIAAYERSPLPWFLAWLVTLFCGRGRISVHRRNFFKISLHRTQLVVCYLCPKVMSQLADKLKEELEPGSWIVSHTFALPGWRPVRLIHANDLYHTPIYLYRVAEVIASDNQPVTTPKVDNNTSLESDQHCHR